MKKPSKRIVYVIMCFLACAALSIVYHLEYIDELMPCPLCILQRIMLVTILGFAFIAALHNPKRIGHKIYSVYLLLFSLTGGAIAMRQLWLQSLPPSQAPTTCGVSLSYLLQALPFNEAVKHIFQGTAECTQITWTFLGLGMAAWSLMTFILLGALAVWQVARGENGSSSQANNVVSSA